MRTRSLKKAGGALLFKNNFLATPIVIISFFFPVLSLAASPGSWISRAENACIYDGNYTVNRRTEVYEQAPGSSAAVRSSAATRGRFLESRSGQLSYTQPTGLRAKGTPPGKSPSPSGAGTAPSPPRPSAFTLDVAHMLQKMKGKAQWVLEDETSLVAGQASVVLSSSGEKWLLRLWIRKNDGVVLRVDTYLNDQFISTSELEYYPPTGRTYLPEKTSTRFHLTGHTFVQEYDGYSFSPGP